MEFTLSMGILVFATAIILLCSFAIIVTSAAADIDSGLHRAKDNVCANDPVGKGCQQICKFVNCGGLEVKNSN